MTDARLELKNAKLRTMRAAERKEEATIELSFAIKAEIEAEKEVFRLY